MTGGLENIPRDTRISRVNVSVKVIVVAGPETATRTIELLVLFQAALVLDTAAFSQFPEIVQERSQSNTT